MAHGDSLHFSGRPGLPPAGSHLGRCRRGAAFLNTAGGDQESSHPKVHGQPRTEPTPVVTGTAAPPPAGGRPCTRALSHSRHLPYKSLYRVLETFDLHPALTQAQQPWESHGIYSQGRNKATVLDGEWDLGDKREGLCSLRNVGTDTRKTTSNCNMIISHKRGFLKHRAEFATGPEQGWQLSINIVSRLPGNQSKKRKETSTVGSPGMARPPVCRNLSRHPLKSSLISHAVGRQHTRVRGACRS